MGTRAVVRVNLEPLQVGKDIVIATHWDGYPDVLGENLVEEIKKETQKRAKKGRDITTHTRADILQTAIYKGASESHIDYVNLHGLDAFNDNYGDWAEYVYKINPDGTVEYTEGRDALSNWDTANWKKVTGSTTIDNLAELKKKRMENKLDNNV